MEEKNKANQHWVIKYGLEKPWKYMNRGCKLLAAGGIVIWTYYGYQQAISDLSCPQQEQDIAKIKLEANDVEWYKSRYPNMNEQQMKELEYAKFNQDQKQAMEELRSKYFRNKD